jgi:hypothetical protein
MNENGERQKKEEEYWGQHHSAQPYATKDHPFQPYAAAYRAGVNAFSAYPDQDFEDFIDEVALNYERENPGSPLPWDHARHAVHAALAKLSNEVTPLDLDHGVRTSFLILGR